MVARSVVVTGARRVGKVSRALFATLALLLTATHCVEIDDRELEETNPVCEVDSLDDACGVCVKEECCDTFAACVESFDCTDFNTCLQGCNYDGTCTDPCAAAYPEGALIFADYLFCSTERCPTECSSADGA